MDNDDVEEEEDINLDHMNVQELVLNSLVQGYLYSLEAQKDRRSAPPMTVHHMMVGMGYNTMREVDTNVVDRIGTVSSNSHNSGTPDAKVVPLKHD